MSFNTYEVSNQDGKPIQLYRFSRGVLAWCYTNADREIVFPSGPEDADETYEPVAISDSGIAQGDNEDVKITLPSRTEVVQMFRGTAPSDEIAVTIRGLHFGDTDAAILWVGSVGDVGRPDDVSGVVNCKNLNPSFKRGGLRLPWSKGCPHFLYDGECRVDKELHRVTTMLTTIVDAVTIMPADTGVKPIEKFAGGFVEWEIADSVFERRYISAGADGNLTIFGATDGMTEGMEIFLFPGCRHTISACDEDFENHLNYGGHPHKVDKSPFDGDPIF
jgi:uncharacterized phage protein (TIGR02218 family)